MKIKFLAIPLLALSLGTAGLITAKAQQGPPPPAPGYDQDRDRGGWDAPPAEFREAKRQGFHDGIEGARKDFEQHRRNDVNNRDEYRHPRVERTMREDYKEGYRRGYETAMSHMMGDHDRNHDHDHDHDDHQ
jgi:hypothetical protein